MSFDLPNPPIVEVTDINEQLLENKITPAWYSWFSIANLYLQALTQSGTTAQRPTSMLWIGRMYFDLSLGSHGKPIWRDKANANWVDAAGNIV